MREAEKVLTHLGDRLARQRQQLPWVPVHKDYVFDTEDGEETLDALVGGRSQLPTLGWTSISPAA